LAWQARLPDAVEHQHGRGVAGEVADAKANQKLGDHVDSAVTLAPGLHPLKSGTQFNGNFAVFVDVTVVDDVLDAPTRIQPGASAAIFRSLVPTEAKKVLTDPPLEITVTAIAGSVGGKAGAALPLAGPPYSLIQIAIQASGGGRPCRAINSSCSALRSRIAWASGLGAAGTTRPSNSSTKPLAGG
jgi:hypothetical protein